MAPIFDTEIEAFLKGVYEKRGFSAGAPPIAGFISGAMAIPCYTLETKIGTLAYNDVQFGRKAKGGLGVVSHNDNPALLIQNQGGCHPELEVREAAQISGFVQEALFERRKVVRLPNSGSVHFRRIRGDLFYYGIGFGGIFDFNWVEVVLRSPNPAECENIPPGWMTRDDIGGFWSTAADEVFALLNSRLQNEETLVFYQVLRHQKIN